jgi:outer membrane receptor protein involved in Fe transport
MKNGRALLLALTISVFCGLSHAQAAITRFKLNIEPQPLGSALMVFGEQSGVQVLMKIEDGEVESREAPRMVGEFTVEAALEKMLKGSGLTYELVNERTVRVSAAGEESKRPLEIAGAQSESPRTSERTDTSGTSVAQGEGAKRTDEGKLEEVLVTGSHIRGAGHLPSQLLQFDRAAIEQSVYATTDQFLTSLPQNFGGGGTVTTASGVRGGEGSMNNKGQGSGINLRGLGNDSTLVLLNGHRMAPTGIGNFVDISMIPLNALERIDVLMDGASAVYGSDAVGGVVNFVTRKGYSGLETYARYGSVTDGNHHERQISQVLGSNWASGSGLLSYTYYDRSRLGSERNFPATVGDSTGLIGPVDLVPPEKRQGVFGSLAQDIGERIHLISDNLYSVRDTTSNFNFAGDDYRWGSKVKQYQGVLGAKVDLKAGWQTEFSAGYSNAKTTFTPVFNNTTQTPFDSTSEVKSFDANVDGPAVEMPGGSARIAVGAHGRRESYDVTGWNSARTNFDRNVYAGYAELSLPLVGTPNRMRGLESLELSLATRYERYEKIGSTTNPKIGLVWKPSSALAFRSSYGRSFRAPIFNELDASTNVAAAFMFPDPLVASGQTAAIVLFGSNPELDPQKARTWSAGVDIEPEALSGFKASLTYFNIDFRDRIGTPIPTVNLFGTAFLADPAYTTVIDRTPDPTVVGAIFADPSFFDATGGVGPSGIGAIVDERLGNISRRREDGLDFSIARTFEATWGAIVAQGSGTYLFSFEDQSTPTTSFSDLLNTVSWPVDLRLRGSLDWRRQAFSIGATANYVDRYRDVRPDSTGSVGSWTTIDLRAEYKLEHWTSFLSNGSHLSLALAVQNAFDRRPPHVAELTPNRVTYDPTNSSPVGRFVAADLRLKW